MKEKSTTISMKIFPSHEFFAVNFHSTKDRKQILLNKRNEIKLLSLGNNKVWLIHVGLRSIQFEKRNEMKRNEKKRKEEKN